MTKDKIDLVYVSIKKDRKALEFAIEHAKKNVENLGKIFVVSKNCLTNKAIWFSEDKFPFSKEEVKKRMKITNKREGWYFQQLLKYYSPLLIPNISKNILISCSDSLFLSKVKFIDEKGKFLFNVFENMEVHKPYLKHIHNLFPGITKFQQQHGTCHHMIFNKAIIKEMINKVEKRTGNLFWKEYLSSVEKKEIEKAGASDYESYYNYMFFYHKNKCKIRKLKWFNDGLFLNKNYINFHKFLKYDGISFHSHQSNKKITHLLNPKNWLQLIISYLKSER